MECGLKFPDTIYLPPYMVYLVPTLNVSQTVIIHTTSTLVG
jgi:hypothetical protein